jgi:hypothetical protein
MDPTDRYSEGRFGVWGGSCACSRRGEAVVGGVVMSYRGGPLVWCA